MYKYIPTVVLNFKSIDKKSPIIINSSDSRGATKLCKKVCLPQFLRGSSKTVSFGDKERFVAGRWTQIAISRGGDGQKTGSL